MTETTQEERDELVRSCDLLIRGGITELNPNLILSVIDDANRLAQIEGQEPTSVIQITEDETTKTSRERRAELREDCDLRAKPHSGSKIVSLPANELRALLDYADQRDEAVALLRRALPVLPSSKDWDLRTSIDALLRRVGETDE